MEIFFEIKADNVEYLQAILNSDISPDHTFKNNGNRSIPEIFNDETPIISIASFYGSLKCLSFLTEKGADINKFSQNKFRFIPIHYSIAGNQQKSFDFLLNHNSNKNGIIFAAVHFLNLDMFNFIIENKLDDVNYSDEFVRAPIIEAVEKKSIKIASVLLQNSANFTQGLVDSCQKSKEFQELFNSFQEQLIKEEIGITTPLHTAADQNNYEEAKRIIEEGKIDINAVNQNGDTALMKASHRGSLQIVKLLLEQPNIDINHKNKGGILNIFFIKLHFIMLLCMLKKMLFYICCISKELIHLFEQFFHLFFYSVFLFSFYHVLFNRINGVDFYYL